MDEIVFEIRPEYVKDAAEIVENVKQNIISKTGLVPTRLVAIKDRTILKTISGKIQRRANCQALHDNTFDIKYETSMKNGKELLDRQGQDFETDLQLHLLRRLRQFVSD